MIPCEHLDRIVFGRNHHFSRFIANAVANAFIDHNRLIRTIDLVIRHQIARRAFQTAQTVDIAVSFAQRIAGFVNQRLNLVGIRAARADESAYAVVALHHIRKIDLRGRIIQILEKKFAGKIVNAAAVGIPDEN